MSEKLLILDGNSILNRAFYAIKGPRMLTKSDGTPTNAVYGFLNILHKYVEEEALIIWLSLLILRPRHSLMKCLRIIRQTERGCQMSWHNNCPLLRRS